ncbi:MAG: 6-bladed beta-propeller [Bacteroidales bacterium]
MQKTIAILATTLLMVTGCTGEKQSTDELITIDVTTSYPKKELILQDFMDVEYIPLETTDEFLCRGRVSAVGKKTILVRNIAIDGEILLFDRNGKGIKKINRRGQSGEEYSYIHGAILDETNGEIFINDNSRKGIFVYDLDGKFRRFLKHKENSWYSPILHNYNEEEFIWWNSSFEADKNAVEMPSFFITSKQDGSIVKEIEIPIEERRSTNLLKYNDVGKVIEIQGPFFIPTIPYQDKLIFTEPSSDTIYYYSPDHRLKPFIVKTPATKTMETEIFLFPWVLLDDYYFMQISKKAYNVPKINIMYDKKTGAICEYEMYNDDFTNKQPVSMIGRIGYNGDVIFWDTIEAFTLVEAYKKGELKGRLKEIAATLNEESNPVIMLAKYKK